MNIDLFHKFGELKAENDTYLTIIFHNKVDSYNLQLDYQLISIILFTKGLNFF